MGGGGKGRSPTRAPAIHGAAGGSDTSPPSAAVVSSIKLCSSLTCVGWGWGNTSHHSGHTLRGGSGYLPQRAPLAVQHLQARAEGPHRRCVPRVGAHGVPPAAVSVLQVQLFQGLHLGRAAPAASRTATHAHSSRYVPSPSSTARPTSRAGFPAPHTATSTGATAEGRRPGAPAV